MNKAKKLPVNRCFGQNSQSDQQRQDKVKEVLTAASQRKLAQRAINCLREERGCSLVDLLTMVGFWARSGRISLYVFEYLVERVEQQRERDVLSFDKTGKTADLAKAKLFLAELKK